MNTTQVCERIQSLSRKALIEVHKVTGIPYSTLEAIKRKRTKDPRGLTVDRLRDYFEKA